VPPERSFASVVELYRALAAAAVNIFVTGAAGYIGRTLAQRLVKEGHTVHGLVRSPEKARCSNKPASAHPRHAGRCDNPQKAASESGPLSSIRQLDHRAASRRWSTLSREAKSLIHTSVRASWYDDAGGDFEKPEIYHDDKLFSTPAHPASARSQSTPRCAQPVFFRSASGHRHFAPRQSTALAAPKKGSDQIPKLIGKSKERGAGVYMDKDHRWSNVHIDD